MAASDIVFGNFAQAKLATPPAGTGGLSFSIAAGKGALFPSPVGGQYFYGIFANAARTVYEIVKVSARATDAFTISAAGRGLDGTTAQTWTANDFFYYGLTAAMLSEFFGHVSQVTGAHAASAISNTPNVGSGGNISSMDVQSALNELDTEKIGLASAWTTGDAKITLKNIADTGWVFANDGTLGNGASGGTTRANADTQALYTLLWTNFADADCPVSTGRGANAAADFTANKTIKLPLAVGRSLAIAGTVGGLTARTLGHAVGEETHLQTVGELPAHVHGVTDPGHLHGGVLSNSGVGTAGGGGNVSGVVANTAFAATGIAIQSQGGGAAFNVMQPTNFMNMMIKL